MALTLYQKSNDTEKLGEIYPHSCNYPGFFSCISTYATLKYDFQYIFRIYDSSGLILEKYNSPNKDNLGVFNSSVVIKNFLEISLDEVFTPTSTNYFKEYRVTVQEYYDGSEQGTEVYYEKSLGGNLYYNQTDSLLPYTITNDRFRDFYTNQIPDVQYKQTLGTRGTWILSNDSSLGSYDEIKITCYMQLGDSDYVEWEYSLEPLTQYDFDTTTGSTIEDASSLGIQIPVGYATLVESSVDRIGYRDIPSGLWHADTGSQTGINTQISQSFRMIRMDVQLYYLGSSVSPKYSWKFPTATWDTDCVSKNITINWENVYGGIDFFDFNMVRDDKITNNTKVYEHNNFTYNSNYLYTDTSKRNMSVYNSDKIYSMNLKTDFLSKSEIELLKGLWFSNLLTVYIDGVQYPIVSITKSVEIPSKEKVGFVMYKINVIYSKII